MRGLPAVIVLASWLSGCGSSDPVPELETLVGPLDTFSKRSEGLDRVLASDDRTPGNQSLLYVAIAEAQAASDSANRAIAFDGEPIEVMNALGEAIYAIEPAEAPAWAAKRSGLVPRWQGLGYGVRPATSAIIDILRGLEGQGGNGATIGSALICSENVLARSEQILSLAERYRLAVTPGPRTSPEDKSTSPAESVGEVADAPSPPPSSPGKPGDILAEIRELARALNRGRDLDGDGRVALSRGECGLSDVERLLDQIRIDPGLT